MSEKRYRNILKAFSWRLTGTIDTFIFSFLVTGKFKFALSISVIELFTKITLYDLHERLWNKIDAGRIKSTVPDYEL